MGTSLHLVSQSSGYIKLRMNARVILVAVLACIAVAPAFATIPLIFASNGGVYAGNAVLPTGLTSATTIGGGTVLLGALGLTIGKALLLRELLNRRRSSRRGRREALPEISDQQAAEFITNLLAEYNQYQ